MSRIVVAVCILALMVGFIGFHTREVLALNKDVDSICEKIEKDFQDENWDNIKNNLDDLENRWKKSRFWSCLTISTEDIEEIEISLEQCKKYAKIEADDNFIGEFVMLKQKMEHLPHQEGFSIEELL